MKSMKKRFALLMAVLLLLGSFSTVAATEIDIYDEPAGSYDSTNGYDDTDDYDVTEDEAATDEDSDIDIYINQEAVHTSAGISVLSSTIPPEFDIHTGSPVQSIPPANLESGEIWTGKSVEYNSDGTVTITLHAWGNTWGANQMPLCPSNPYITITDDLGEFHFDNTTGIFPGNVTHDISNNTVTWSVHQSDIIAGDVSVSYVVYLDETDWQTGYWYSTGTAEVEFYPVTGNPFYWTREETTIDAFTTSMSWNNGNGLNSGMIIDNIFNTTIHFGANRNSPEGQSADTSIFPNHWNHSATVNGQTFYWHLEWFSTNDPKTYIFTIRDLEAPGVHVTYEIIFDNPGGNASRPGGRTLVSTTYFQRGFVEGNPSLPLNWDGEAIVYTLDVVAQIQLQNYPLPVGSLQVNKALEGWFELDWNVGSETPFQAILTNQDGLYVTFEAEAGINQYTYTGLVGTRELATVITFSVDHPAVIAGIPSRESALPSAPVVRYFLEEIFEVHTNLIQVTYSFGIDGFIIAPDATTAVTVTNAYQHGVGYLEVHKLFDGFPLDWGIDDETVFYVRIWDVDRGNYLLFKDYQGPDGTFQRVGNHVFGLTEDYQGMPIMELPISVDQPLRLSHLWTWGKYEVREVRVASPNPIMSEWEAFWNSVDLDRDPTFQNRPGGVWTDGIWMTETWLDHWEYVREITNEATWNADDDWVWGVTYSDNNGVRELHFYETILVTMTNHYKYSSGNMTIMKDLAGFPEHWGVNEDTVFHAKLWALRDHIGIGQGYALIFERIHRANFEDVHRSFGDYIYRNIGYINSTGVPVFYNPNDAGIDFLEMVSFGVNSPALIIGLPVYDDYFYRVEEFFADDAFTDHINVRYSWNNREFDATANRIPVDVNSSTIVHIQNDYAQGTGDLVVVKELTGFPGDWGVDEFEEFFIGVRQAGTTTYLHFAPQANGTFQYSSAGGAGTIQFLPFGAANSAIITGLPIGVSYVIDELDQDGNDIYDVFTTGFEVTVAPDTITLGNNENAVVTVTNAFEHGTGTLEIYKWLGGAYAALGVDQYTVFYARVRDATDTDYMTFVLIDEDENIWRSVSSDADGAQEIIPFSVDKPAILTNLWSGRVYVIEELPDDDLDFTSEHTPLGIMWNSDTLEVDITNHFEIDSGGNRGGGNRGGGVTPQAPPEEDVPERKAYLIGRPDGTIRPAESITRAEVATIFFRLIPDEVRANYWMQENPFEDVHLTSWFNNAISTTTNMGLFHGEGEGQFAPNQPITRAELAVVMARFYPYAEIGPYTGSENMFNDIAGHWAREYINEATRQGWIMGQEGIGGPFLPDQAITRAETAAMINRLFERLVETPYCLVPERVRWPDKTNPYSWYYLYMASATNSYTYERRECDVFKTWLGIVEPPDWSVLERPDSRPEDLVRRART